MHRVPDRRLLLSYLVEAGAGFRVLIVSVRLFVSPLERASHAHSSVAQLPVVNPALLIEGRLPGFIEKKSVGLG